MVSSSLLSGSLYRNHVLTAFLGPVLGAMMKQLCWHSRRSKAYRGLPETRGQSEAHGDSNLYTVPLHRLEAWKAACVNSWIHRHGVQKVASTFKTYLGQRPGRRP